MNTSDKIRNEPPSLEVPSNEQSQEPSYIMASSGDHVIDENQDECRNETEEVDKNEEDSLEWMIETMMTTVEDDGNSSSDGSGICADPRHYHSFSSSNLGITNYFLRPSCFFCNKRISNYYHIVKCVACANYAHRSCSFSTSTDSTKCPVNKFKIGPSPTNSTESNEKSNDEPPKNPSIQACHNDDQSNIDYKLIETNLNYESSSNTEQDGFKYSISHNKEPHSHKVEVVKEVKINENNSLENEEKKVTETSTKESDNDKNKDDLEDKEVDHNQCFVSENNEEETTITVSDSKNAIGSFTFRQMFSSFTSSSTIKSNNDCVETQANDGSVTDDDESSRQHKLSSSQHPPSNFEEDAKEDKSISTECPNSQGNINDSEHDEDNEKNTSCWSNDGPPEHWASVQTLENIAYSQKSQSNKSIFQNVSRLLQEQVMLLKSNSQESEVDEKKTQKGLDDNENSLKENSEPKRSQNQKEAQLKDPLIEMIKENTDNIVQNSLPKQRDVDHLEHSANENVKQENLKPILKESLPKPPPPTNLQKAKEIGKAVNRIRNANNDWTVYAAGTLAGSVAGLVIAGPAGVMIGCKVGQVAGLVVEGTMSVGVLAASGVLAWTTTKNHLLQNKEERILKIGDKTKSNLVLVRPGVTVDPIWQDITGKARKQYHEYIFTNNTSRSSKLNILTLQTKPKSPQEVMEDARHLRLRKDSDIITADEYEIATEEKIMLLVSRMLNDRMSLPGFIHQYLMNEHKERARKQWFEEQEELCNEGSGTNNDTISSNKTKYSRTKREDTHAVIKHITATLLEVRPGFAASSRITEMSATAVESLVFGELYDSIFDEIVTETRRIDESLQIKITEFDIEQQQMRRKNENDMSSHSHLYYEYLSDSALSSLRKLPESHSAVEKLAFCVEFLELISVHFDDENKNNSATQRKRTMGADALLKMVCQHIIAAKIPNLNAEIAFIEEFARDEQLLRGKEGYALVTIQASLNFLNASENFEQDIFYDDCD